MIGQRPNYDISVSSLLNIPKDTFYSPGTDTVTVNPQALVNNIGTSNINVNFRLILDVPELNYHCDTTVGTLNSGQSAIVNFTPLVILPNIPFQAMVYSNLEDTNHFNDTLEMNSLMRKGVKRKILLEEFTSTTSQSCASNNPFLDTFIINNFSDICPVKYHLGYPSPGNDSMYLLNPVPQDQRRFYYSIYALPSTILDGKEFFPTPYNSDSALLTMTSKLLSNGSPVQLNISDTRIPGDTIKSNIQFTVYQNLRPGGYKLRVLVVERVVNYQIPPGANGEKTFYDVFRMLLTDSAGFIITPFEGRYEYNYYFHRSSNWVDSMIYTIAFIQNDDTKEILNSAKSRNVLVSYNKSKYISNIPIRCKPDIIPGLKLCNSKFSYYSMKADTIYGDLKYEFFEEGFFPPTGWNLLNTNVGFTFNQIYAINGISMQGFRCVQIPFYYNADIGRKDTLISVALSEVYPTDTLRFDYAYAQYLSNYADSLKVNLSTDGGATYSNIFNKGGSLLATAQSTTLAFAPSTPSEWRTFAYPLNQVLPSNISNIIPSEYVLFQNYPNPFNPLTTITYSLPVSGFVTIKVYDVTGKELRTLKNEIETPGKKELIFDGKNFSSGVYFYVLKVNDFRSVKKMVLIK